MPASRAIALSRRQPAPGFTLIEMAVALVVIALLLASLLMPLQKQVEQRKITETQKILDQAMDALTGFAAANGRLPCPASSTSNGVESPPGGGNCTNPYNGFFPAATLGIAPTDAQGYLVDGWGLSPQNRVLYAVSTTSGNAFTTSSGMKNTGMSTLSGATTNLYICSTASGITATNCGTATPLSIGAVAVVYSLGADAATGGTGADEAANLDNDPIFVWHTPTDTNAPNGEFDDIMVWMSPNVLFSKMISAGQLP